MYYTIYSFRYKCSIKSIYLLVNKGKSSFEMTGRLKCCKNHVRGRYMESIYPTQLQVLPAGLTKLTFVTMTTDFFINLGSNQVQRKISYYIPFSKIKPEEKFFVVEEEKNEDSFLWF